MVFAICLLPAGMTAGRIGIGASGWLQLLLASSLRLDCSLLTPV
jgi:hypothetical protein